MASTTAGADRFQIEEAGDCGKGPSPPCGQGANLPADDTQSRRTVGLVTAGVEDLGLLQDRVAGGLVAFVENTLAAGKAARDMIRENRLIPDLTLMNLATGVHLHIQLSGHYGPHLSLIPLTLCAMTAKLMTMRIRPTPTSQIMWHGFSAELEFEI